MTEWMWIERSVLRIAHIVYECEPGRFLGGVQKMVYELSCAQAARGDLVEIFTIGDSPSVQCGDRLRIRYFPGRFHFGSVELGAALQSEHERFDVFHSHNTFLPLNRYAAFLARRFGRPVFFHVHGALDPVLLKGWGLKPVKKWIYNSLFERPNLNRARGVIGLTMEECRQFRRFGVHAPLFEVGNGIEPKAPAAPEEIRAFRERVGIGPGDPVILFIGRINPKKGLHFLIEAMAAVRRAVPEVRLVIGGGREAEPHYTRELDALVSRLGLGATVRWAGFLDEVAKQAAFGSATIFAHPSLSEGMAMAVLEAMAAGLPTVVTPGCYMERAVAAGALIETTQRPEDIAATLLELHRDAALHQRVGSAGAAYVRAHHTWSVLAARLDRIYRGEVEPAIGSDAPSMKDAKQRTRRHAHVPHEARALFDDVALHWERRYDEKGSMLYRQRRFLEELSAFSHKGARLLDFGCASGDLTFAFCDAGFKVSGLDQSGEMIKRAQARQNGRRVDFTVATASADGMVRLPYPDGEFDVVLASSVAEYLVPLEAYLGEWSRVSARGAALILTVPNLLHPLRWIESAEGLAYRVHVPKDGKLRERARYLQTSVNRFTLAHWRRMLRAYGWKIEKTGCISRPLAMLVARKGG